jgi:hypothetical protein
MSKVKHFTVSNQENPEKIVLQNVKNRSLEAHTDSMALSSFGGLAPLAAEEERLGIAAQLASCIRDTRQKHLVRHSLEEIIKTRLLQICLGYEDDNDCDRNKKEVMMQLAVNGGDFNKDICSSATMCRFENMVTDEDLLAIQELFVTMFVLSYGGKEPRQIILDCDDTNVDTYGVQELTLFNTYYDSYCYMPLLVFEGYSGKLILPLLKPGRRNKTANIADTLQWLIMALRASWPHVVIIVRGDSHFCSHEFMDWAILERGVYYITGLSSNSRLLGQEVVKNLCKEARHDYELFHRPCRKFGHFWYKAGSWLFPQKVVVKVEMTGVGDSPNIRFVVTNLQHTSDDKFLYEYFYCQRGKDELYIREFKEAVNGDRLSCHTFKANRLRIFLYAAAYVLMHSLREHALKDTSLEKASLLRIREQLLLTAVCVKVFKSKIVLIYAKNNPMRSELLHVLRYYRKTA